MAIGKLPDSSDDAEVEAIFAEINITPLTDVFLVLLIIFMVGALAVQVESSVDKKAIKEITAQKDKTDDEKKSGIKVTLPAGQAQEIDPTKASLVLEIPLSGDVHVGGKAVPDDKLDNLFGLAFQHDKSTQVVIKADTGVQHGRVVKLMELAKKAGLIHLAIGTSGG